MIINPFSGIKTLPKIGPITPLKIAPKTTSKTIQVAKVANSDYTQNTSQKGRLAEQKVLEKYFEMGYQLVSRNFQFYGQKSQGAGRKGEIDLILSRDGKLALVEVKYRHNLAFGNILEQITKAQLKRIFYSYQYFLTKPEGGGWRNKPVRLDIACVLGENIEILENACTFDDLY